jgi:hypothetical protein
MISADAPMSSMLLKEVQVAIRPEQWSGRFSFVLQKTENPRNGGLPKRFRYDGRLIG